MPVILITHKYYQDKVFYYLLQLLASKPCSNTQGKSVSWHLGRVYSRALPCGTSTIWKKMPHKIYVVASNGAQKNRLKPRINTIFWNKVFENITDNNIDLTAAL